MIPNSPYNHVPIRTILTTLGISALIVFVTISVLWFVLHRPLARRMGWRPWSLLAAGLSLAFAVSFTLVPIATGPVSQTQIFDFPGLYCVFGFPTSVGLMELPLITQESLNALILLPFGLFVALAVRHIWPVVLVVVLVPVVIEGIQGLLPVLERTCAPQDWFDNASGGLLGVLIGRALRAALRRRHSK